MKPKLNLCIALVLSGGLFGCSTTPHAAKTKVFDYSIGNSPVTDEVVVTGLGKSFSIQASADSWHALVKKVKPTFAWNGCDMIWIENDTNGQPQFVLDEAYIYQPTNQSRLWVLLKNERDIPNDELRQETPEFFYSMYNLHAIATLHDKVLGSDDAGGRGDYAAVIGAHPQYGTVYEIGWQREMSVGSNHAQDGRRIYVWKDRINHWHFLGEGPGEESARGGGETMASKVVWENSPTNDLPFQIRFHLEQTTSPYNYSADYTDTNDPSSVTICYDSALVAEPPAQGQSIGHNPYLLAEKDDTLETITLRLGFFLPGWGAWPDEAKQQAQKKRILEAWRAAIIRLNPKLPQHGIINEGTRVDSEIFNQ